MIGRLRRQSLLLDRYWNALRGARHVAPPAGLDTDLARLADVLARESAQLEPADAFLDDLRRQLRSQATSGLNAARGWSAPALAPHPHLQPASDDAKEHDMSRPSLAPLDEPIDFKQRLGREWLKLAAGIIIFVAIGALLVLTFRDDDNSDQIGAPPTVTPTVSPTPMSTTPAPAATQAAVLPTSTTAVSATSTTAPTVIATVPFAPTPLAAPPGPVAGEVTAYIPLDFEPWEMVLDGNSIWVNGIEHNAVTRVDLESGSVIASVEFEAVEQALEPARSPIPPLSYLQLSGDSLWSYRHATAELVEIDTTTNQIVGTIALPSDGANLFDLRGLAVTDDAIWASDISGRVVRIDPESGEVVATIEAEGPQIIIAAEGSIWVACYGSGTVMRIDPATNQVVAEVATGSGPFGLAAGAGSIWVGNRASGSISRIDPATNQEIARVTVIMAGSAVQRIMPGGVVAADNAVWVTDEYGSALYRLDPATNELAGHVMTPPGIGIILGDGVVWVCVPEEKVLLQILPAS